MDAESTSHAPAGTMPAQRRPSFSLSLRRPPFDVAKMVSVCCLLRTLFLRHADVIARHFAAPYYVRLFTMISDIIILMPPFMLIFLPDADTLIFATPPPLMPVRVAPRQV